MPLAAMKVAVSELPKSFALTDAMAMSPAATISKAKTIVVEARVSKSGNVTPQPGDLAGTSAVLAPGASNVRVTIDRVIR
jgi:cytochrome c-type biogenesis protein CcmH